MADMFKFVGVSRHPNGEMKVRFANDASRVKVLARNGHTDIRFIEMEQPEHKMDCVDALLDWAEANTDTIDGEILAAIADEAEAVGFDIARF